MSHESDDGIVERIVQAVKRRPCLCAVAGACVVGLGCAVYAQNGTEDFIKCKEVVMKKEQVVIGAKVVQVSNNADVEATGQRSRQAVQVSNNADVETANRKAESRFDDGWDLNPEQPGPQNSKEEKKRKEAERRRRLLAAALAGAAAGIKIMSMMPTPDPNENNRLPDKIPNIPTPQEKWFKWLWEKREMRFEYRPLEFIRAYAEKYLEGDAKCVKLPYTYVHNYYGYNNEIEDMKLAKFIIFLVAVNSVSPMSDVTNSNLTPDPANTPPSHVPNDTTKSDTTSSVINKDGRTISPDSTSVPKARNKQEIEVQTKPHVKCETVKEITLNFLMHSDRLKSFNDGLNKVFREYGLEDSIWLNKKDWKLADLKKFLSDVHNTTGAYCILDKEKGSAVIALRDTNIYFSLYNTELGKENSIAHLKAALIDPNTQLSKDILLFGNVKSIIQRDIDSASGAFTSNTTTPGNSPRSILAERDAEVQELKAEITKLMNMKEDNAKLKADFTAQAAELDAAHAKIAELEAAASKAQAHHNHNHANGSTTGTAAQCKTCGK